MTDTRPDPPRSALRAAVVAFQGVAPKLYKESEADTGKYTYKYIDLAGIVEKIQPLMLAHGLAFSSFPCYGPDNSPALRYELTHKDGEYQSGVMPLLAVRDAQAMGSALTYMRRYALCAVLNLVADDDDDGAAAVAQEDLEDQGAVQAPAEHKDSQRPAAPVIPMDRATEILRAAIQCEMASYDLEGNPGDPPVFHPAFTALLALQGVAKIGQLNVDQAENVEAWLRNEAAAA